MTRLLTTAALIVLGLGVAPAANAQPPAQEPRSCFYKHDIQNFSVVDDQTIYLRVGVNDVYRVGLMGGCVNLSFHNSIGIESHPPGSTICSPLDLEVVVGDVAGRMTCQATSLHHLTPAEVAALPKKYRP